MRFFTLSCTFQCTFFILVSVYAVKISCRKYSTSAYQRYVVASCGQGSMNEKKNIDMCIIFFLFFFLI